jgi:kynurenine formamidase
VTSPVAYIQVHAAVVRRPVHSDTFVAIEAIEDGHVVRVRVHWRDTTDERSYTFPIASIVAIRWLDEGEAR